MYHARSQDRAHLVNSPSCRSGDERTALKALKRTHDFVWVAIDLHLDGNESAEPILEHDISAVTCREAVLGDHPPDSSLPKRGLRGRAQRNP